MNRNIIQTPSHLKLFEKVKHDNKVHDYRDSMKRSCEQTNFVKVFFSEQNIKNLESEMNSMMQTKYNYKIKERSRNLVLMVMTNIYNENMALNIEMDLAKLNDKVKKEGLNSYYQAMVGQEKFLQDRNNIHGWMSNPEMTSNKIEKQLPKMSFM